MRTELISASEVCKRFYGDHCRGCPIRRECVDTAPQIVTDEILEAHRQRLEKAASEYLEQSA